MKAQKQQLVTIKGTKNGLSLNLDDACSFEDLLHNLEGMLSLKQYIQDDGPIIHVHVRAGNRLLSSEQEEIVKTAIQKRQNLVVETIDSNVMTKDAAMQLKRETEIKSVAKIVRSGQILQVEGDLLLIGDVNPGGTVIAGGNIFIMGALKGIAHAGIGGNKEAVISASLFNPTQLRISEVLNRAPDHIPSTGIEMECAYLDENDEMVIERLQQLTHIRPALTRT
ncbi:septum site-determining protein MinC [Bacillus sp. IB182487]|uniref:Probable septum site-determining protein MinC n=1 Tax=Metabacillus arenae TaxID=2771434 RepID=A0A926NBH8_9BACI|nr:septum site-determining protein MinC [Metabacillus arenae]MBD1381202.1 septum site-determining protein MinC [Metabacillus arenae]